MTGKAEVISLGGDLPAEQVLKGAMERDFDHVMVIGWMKEPQDGNKFWLSSSSMSDAYCVYALEHAKSLIIELTK